MTTEITLKPARSEDVESLNSLINRAYRGAEGWTRESDLVKGERTSTEDLRTLIQDTKAHVFVASINGGIAACICIEEKGNEAHIGTFAVSPACQNQGLGKRVLRLAEEYAVGKLGFRKLVMSVISQRTELISFYERRGYRRTGKKSKYPVHLNVGTPSVAGLTIEYLEKTI